MIMPPRVRKLVLAVHLTFSGGWMGAAVAYLSLGIVATTSLDPSAIRGAWVAMEVIGWFVIVPMSVGSLLTGLAMALGTKWGLLCHYWVLFAFVLTVVAALVLIMHMPDVSALADTARESDVDNLDDLGGDLFHAAFGLGVLLVIQVLNIYKPPGMTRYGWRKQRGRNGAAA
jgi:hypothetical protein